MQAPPGIPNHQERLSPLDLVPPRPSPPPAPPTPVAPPAPHLAAEAGAVTAAPERPAPAASPPDPPAAEPPRGDAVAVRYALDDVAHRLVAHIFDGETGELLREVPDTRLLHQLEELRRLADAGPHVDARA